jgi:hypothetical protein
MRTPISRVLGEVGRKCPACTLPSITVSSIIDHRVAWPQIRIPNIRRTHKKMGHAADWPSSLQLLLFAPSKSIPIGCAYSVYVRRWLAGWRATHDMTIIVTPLRQLQVNQFGEAVGHDKLSTSVRPFRSTASIHSTNTLRRLALTDIAAGPTHPYGYTPACTARVAVQLIQRVRKSFKPRWLSICSG